MAEATPREDPPGVDLPTVLPSILGAAEQPTVLPPATVTVAAAGGHPTLPGYEILGELGRGGMGVVYRARQVGLNRVVALKMILAGGHASGEVRQRFLAEAQAVARLRHPNVVHVFDVGEHEGKPYFALEFVAGGSLDRHLAGTPRPPEEAAALVAALARAMQHAHEQGIVHRDLKPANVLLQGTTEATEKREAGKRGEALLSSSLFSVASVVKIADFGLAKVLDGDSGQTKTGQIMGTPSYMAPEQAEGKRDVGPLADVYALGAILYECLTGRPPFKAATPLDTVLQVIEAEPALVRQLQPAAPRDLETVALKCLHKDPGRRYASAAALAADLERYLRGEPITARPAGAVEKLGRWCRRNPGVAGLTAALALALGAGTVVSILFAMEAQTQAETATRESQRAEANAGRAALKAAEADRERRAALAYAAESFRNQYLAQVTLAEAYWDQGNVAPVRVLQERYRQLPAASADPRGWEWYYQDRLLNGPLRTLMGVFNERVQYAVRRPGARLLYRATCLAFSPDGAVLASGHADEAVRLWNTATGQLLYTLPGHPASVSGVAFSPDGRRLASASLGTVHLWDPATGRLLGTLGEAARGLVIVGGGGSGGVAFSPDGTRLAYATQDPEAPVRIWDAGTGKLLQTLRGAFWTLAFSPDGATLATGSEDYAVKLWDVATGRERFVLRGHANHVWKVAFSPDGARLVSAGYDQTVRVWNLSTGQLLRALADYPDPVTGLAFHPSGKYLATASGQGVQWCDAATGKLLNSLTGHANLVCDVALSPDGTRLASADDGQTVHIWDVAVSQPLRTIRGASDWIAFSPEGTHLASPVENSGIVRFYDVATGQPIRALESRHGTFRGAAFSRDGRRLSVATTDQQTTTVQVWDFATGKVLDTFTLARAAKGMVSFTPDKTCVAFKGEDDVARLWHLATGRHLATFPRAAIRRGKAESSSTCSLLAFDPGGQRVASGGDALGIWDVATGRLLHTLDERALEVAFHPSGTLLASAGNGRVRLWDVTTGQCVATLLGHRDEVSSVAFSPDGTRLATGSFDQTVKVWDVATGQLLRTLAGHSQGIWGVAFSPDGLRLASAGQEQAVRIWDARPLTPALQVEREALGLLDYYLGQPMLKDQAADHIRKHKAITDEVRRQALTFLPRYRDELNSFVNAAVAVAQKPDATAKEYQAALGHALTAIQLNPGDDAFRTAFVLGTLGMAQYRCGQLPQALITLTQGRNVLLGDDSPRILADVGKLLMSPWALPVACNYQRCFFPPHLAFLAMAQHRSGQREAAQESLAVLRFLAQEPAWNSDPLVHQFLHEAETVIGVSHPPAQP